MFKLTRLFGFLAMMVLTAAWVAPAQAQATRTWVSGLGSDSNPCSRTAPCKTFAGAYGLTAAGGEIDVLDGGGYGTLTISKSITIDGGGGQVASVLASGTNGITVSGSGVVVTLRNLNIDGTGAGLAGIYLSNGAQLSILNCDVSGFMQYGIGFAPSAAGSRLIVQNTTVHDNPGYGIVVVPTITSGTPTVATFDGVTVFHNGSGLAAFDNTEVQVTRSDFSDNNGNGVTSVSSSAAASLINLEETTVSNNGANGLQTTGAVHPIINISNTYISGNVGSSMLISSGQVVSFGNNRITANGTNTAPNGTYLQQ